MELLEVLAAPPVELVEQLMREHVAAEVEAEEAISPEMMVELAELVEPPAAAAEVEAQLISQTRVVLEVQVVVVKSGCIHGN